MGEETIDEYLRFVAKHSNVKLDWKYRSYEALLLDCGTFRKQIDVQVERGPLGDCFKNALQFALDSDGEYGYCEGYAIHPALPIPIQHAWVTNDHGDALDVTWEYEDGTYFGVDFSIEWALHFMVKSGYYGIFGNDWRMEHTLLVNGLP